MYFPYNYGNKKKEPLYNYINISRQNMNSENYSNLTSTISPRTKLISDDLAQLFFVVNFVVICGLVSVFGVTANILNVIVFLRQGFKDRVNISLFALTVSDLCSLIALLWITICFNPLFKFSDIPFMSTEVHYLTGSWPRFLFTRVTGWITAFITFERCVCVAAPLKVKTIITRRRVTVCMAGIVVLVSASVAPTYYTSRFGWKYFPARNRTLLGLVFTADREEIDSVSFIYNNVISALASFVAVLVCTVVLVVKLNQKQNWREKSVQVSRQQNQEGTVSAREKKVGKMVTVISVIFIVSFMPNCFMSVIIAEERDFTVTGLQVNVVQVFFSFTWILEALNGSVNIFVYYRMSTRYRNALISLLQPSPGDRDKKRDDLNYEETVDSQ
ncbi:unnamed protein product [Lymnaea stagnalis]|uniref:G-protein coupled receptors family 1 profile domain-containing protein n=1 Tax=Lymnaea stagnalis TaxID=6523 RepID=A0AAV2IIH5_LYMST